MTKKNFRVILLIGAIISNILFYLYMYSIINTETSETIGMLSLIGIVFIVFPLIAMTIWNIVEYYKTLKD